MKKLLFGFLQALMRFNSAVSSSNQKGVDKKITKALQGWIADKKFCIPDQTLSEVAEDLDVSPNAFSYYCVTVLKERFTSFRKKLRLAEARAIIERNPDEKLINVAYMVGIQDKCNFRRQFYEVYGMTPGEWREKCRKKNAEK